MAAGSAALARQAPSLGASELAQLLLAHRSTISREAPLRLAFERSPRLAASAAPAAICCFFDLAGMTSSWQPTSGARPKAASVPRKMCTGAEGSGGSTWGNADGSQGEAWDAAYTDFEG